LTEVSSVPTTDTKRPGDSAHRSSSLNWVDGLGDKGSGDTATIYVETLLEAILEDVPDMELFTSTVQGSGFPENIFQTE
jgi:hypothetical protein